MKKTITVLLLLNVRLAYGDMLVENAQNTCDFVLENTELVAVFTPTQYTCAADYYLPANHDGCEACPNAYSCVGGTYSFNEEMSQGLQLNNNQPINSTNNWFCAINMPITFDAVFTPNQHTCSTGQYLPANVDACTICPSGSACIGGTYTFNETIDQGIQSCASGTYSPSGSSICYPHILHIGDNNVYLKSTKQTTPSLNIKIGDDIFYAHMTTIPTKMNKDSTRYFRVQWPNNDYYVCDDTTCPQ